MKEWAHDVHRGFGGSHLSDVIHSADRVALPDKPRLILLCAGDNDIAAGKSAPRVFADWRRFIGLVHVDQPTAHIVFLRIKPSCTRWSLRPEMQKADHLMRGRLPGR